MFTKQKNVYKTKKLQTRYVYKTKYKRKVYKHVMFTKQNKCLQYKCLQNKSLLTRYVYKTKYKTESLQNKTKVYKTNVYKTKVYKHVMFT